MGRVVALRVFWSIAGALLGAGPSICEGCLWFYGTDLQGFRVEVNMYSPEEYVVFRLESSRSFEDWKQSLARFEQQTDSNTDSKLRSDRAALLIYTGEPQAAIPI